MDICVCVFLYECLCVSHHKKKQYDKQKSAALDKTLNNRHKKMGGKIVYQKRDCSVRKTKLITEQRNKLE